MATTIQVSDLTKQRLQMMKEEKHASSYDVIIVEMINKEKKLKSGFGIFKGMKWNKEEDRPKDREL
ncbi:MAG TPA: hypothetical protein VJH88_01020 [Candidatus Nanoarchaeia archaeon]|nr:hypothetical protein [Candidatus Nanoarchaeia archaeon]